MTRQQACTQCGALLDVSSMDAGQVVRCGGCGARLEVGTPPARAPGPPPLPPPPPPPIPRRAAAGGRRVRDAESPADPAEKDRARERLKAARFCRSSMYCAIAGGIAGWLVAGWVGSAAAGIASVVLAALGLGRLARVGLGAEHLNDAPGLVRTGARMAKSGKMQGVLGLAIGLGWLGLAAVLLIVVTR